MTDVRTRFAPSPTGFMHVGGVRTALFAWLLARQSGGQFILRLEDTDQKREVAGSAEHIIRALDALGIHHDEGPDIGGPYAPYVQSERLDTYNNGHKNSLMPVEPMLTPTRQKSSMFSANKQKTRKKPFYTVSTAPNTHLYGMVRCHFV